MKHQNFQRRRFTCNLPLCKYDDTSPLCQLGWQALKENLAHIINYRCFSLNNFKCAHGQVICYGLHHNLYIASLLIAKYFNCGDSQAARSVFDAQRGRHTKTLIWNSLIKGYIKLGCPSHALEVYQEMIGPVAYCEPDKNTFHLAIRACTQLSEFTYGKIVGSHAQKRGFESDLLVGTSLVDMYSKAGDVSAACQVFRSMNSRDIVTWNTMISAYIFAGVPSEAITLFNQMRFVSTILPTEATMVILTSYYGQSRDIRNGEALHACATKFGFEASLFFVNSLIYMYLKCDRLNVALELFNSKAGKDAASWSTMIGGYVQQKKPYDALKLFRLMIRTTEIFPTRPLLLNVISACADLGDSKGVKFIEKYLVDGGCDLVSDPIIATACIYMYAKCGNIEFSLQLLDKVEKVRGDTRAWNAATKACMEIGSVNVVFELTLEMQRRGICPDHATIVILLSAISCNPFLGKITETHAQIIKRGFEMERQIANSLLDVYAKAGSCMELSKLFEGILEKDVVSWSIMIKAYGLNKEPNEVLHLFELMKSSGVKPNEHTFLALLSACSHTGLTEKGCELFWCMKEQYDLVPGIEHFSCMMDMFCRAGKFYDAHCFLEKVISKGYNHAALWGPLLSAYRLHGNITMAETSARHLFQLEPSNVANYIMLADINISAGRRGDANDIISLCGEQGLKRVLGCSWFQALSKT